MASEMVGVMVSRSSSWFAPVAVDGSVVGTGTACSSRDRFALTGESEMESD